MGAPRHDDIVIPGLSDDAERAAYVRKRRRGVSHERALAPRNPGEGDEVVVELTVGPDVPSEDAWVEVDGRRRPLAFAGAEWDTVAWDYVRRYRGVLPGRSAGAVAYALGVGDIEADDGARQAYVVGDVGPPAWAAEAIVYQVWVDRFSPVSGDGPADRYGGTFRGLTERLDHVEALGANTVWLNPIHPSSAYHGYEVTDYFTVDPALGTLEDFDDLVSELHRRGLRLVLDFVASHVSDRHEAFVAARTNAASPYVSWFRFDRWPDDYRTFFGVPSMPQLNHGEPSVREHLVDAVRFWVGRGVDGLRLDYAGGAAFDVWAELRVAARAERPDCWLFGEVIDTPDVQRRYEGLFDGCLDIQLALALRRAFGYGTLDAPGLDVFLTAHEAAFPASFTRPSFLDNHDLDRMLWIAGGDQSRLRAAAVCQFTLAGPPIVYYGTEVGLSQTRSIKEGGDRQARLPMLWGAERDEGLLAFYAELAALRRALPAAPRERASAEGTRLVYRRGAVEVELDVTAATAVVREGAEVLLRA